MTSFSTPLPISGETRLFAIVGDPIAQAPSPLLFNALFNPPLPTSGETRLFAIVGDPIAQARSPSVFNALFAARGANAVLVPMQVPASQLRCAIGGLKCIANLDGIVVTVPHKVSVVELLD